MRNRIVSVLLVVVLCCSILTGCMGEVSTIQINPDGSGEIRMSIGFTESTIEMMKSMGDDTSSMDSYKPFIYNGVTYYGETSVIEFKNVEEFNYYMNGENTSSDDMMMDESMDIDTGSIKLIQNEDSSFNLVLNVSTETGNVDDIENNLKEETPTLTDEELEVLLDGLAIVFDIEFPANVKLLSDVIAGVKVNGRNLHIDFIELGESITEDTVIEFTTSTVKDITFTDVLDGYWAENAIYSLAYGGLVAGIGNNQFAPNNTLTRAQFYQILARAMGLETGEVDGYWAGGAIKSCKEHNLIIKPFNYLNIDRSEFDMPILREEAVAALSIAVDLADIEFDSVPIFEESDIPDFDKIDEAYQSCIVGAYEVGITNGVDSNKTFNPKGQLTRAQGSQLFYNLNWCEPK